MDYSLLNDEEILKDLSSRLENLRISKEMKDSQLVEKSGVTSVTISKFRSGHNITLKTFIRLLRALGELDRLESFLPSENEWSPLASENAAPKKRVRTKLKQKGAFVWGDEK